MAASKLVHIVWFKWKADAAEAAIKATMDALLALKGKIDVIEDIHLGKNITERSKGEQAFPAGCRGWDASSEIE